MARAVRSEGMEPMTFADLHKETGGLFSDVLGIHPSPALVLFRGRLHDCEKRLDTLLHEFVQADAELLAREPHATSFNSVVITTAHFMVETNVRNSVAGLLTETATTLTSLRNRLDFLGSLAIALASFLVALGALYVAVISYRAPVALASPFGPATTSTTPAASGTIGVDWVVGAC